MFLTVLNDSMAYYQLFVGLINDLGFEIHAKTFFLLSLFFMCHFYTLSYLYYYKRAMFIFL